MAVSPAETLGGGRGGVGLAIKTELQGNRCCNPVSIR